MVGGHPIIISKVSLRFHKNTVFCQKKGKRSERTHNHCHNSADLVNHPDAWGPPPRILEGGPYRGHCFNVTRMTFEYKETVLHLRVTKSFVMYLRASPYVLVDMRVTCSLFSLLTQVYVTFTSRRVRRQKSFRQ
jgi:hypothetical protein